MAFLELPSGTATDFSYRRSVGGIPFVADFQMTEDDFLQWMRARGREPVRIAEGETVAYPVRDYEAGNVLRVKRGWYVRVQKPDNPNDTETFTFDAETGRAYVLLTL